MYIIETSRLGLRNWIESDERKFVDMNRDPRVMEYFPKMLTEEESIAMIDRNKKHISDKEFGLWAVEVKETNEFAGFVGLNAANFEADFTPCIEIGWRLAYQYWGKGYAQEAAKGCIKFGFDNLGFEEIVSFTALTNARSKNVMKKIGMKYIKEFEHPKVEIGSSLRRHVLYSINKEEYNKQYK